MLSRRTLAAAREELLIRKFLIVFSVLRDRLYADLGRAGYPGLSMQHSLVLRHMQVEGITMADLARRARVSRQAIAAIARNLQQRGYLKIASHPDDRRKLVLRFTRKGERLALASIRVAAAIDREIERILGAAEVASLRLQIDRLYAALSATRVDTQRESREADRTGG